MDSIDEVDAHYRKYLEGAPEYVRFVPPDRALIGVLEWPSGSSKLKVHFCATLGLHALIHGRAGHSFEVFAGIRTGSDEFRSALAMLANDLVSEQTRLRAGNLVSHDEGPIIESLPFTSWLMLERFDDLIPELRLANGGHVAFLDATPVFREEAEFLKKYGLDALFRIWEDETTKLTDLNRTIPRALGYRGCGNL